MNQAFVIFPTSHSWSVARIKEDRCQLAPIESIQGFELSLSSALAVAKSLDTLDYHGEGILLALPSQICLCAKVNGEGLRHRSRAATLRFRLEEQLPIAIEDVVVDFASAGQHPLGVAVAANVIGPMIEALESTGIAVASICPVALLVAEEIRHKAKDGSEVDTVLCGLNDQIELVQFQDGQISDWALLPAEPSAVLLHLRHATLHRASPLSTYATGIPIEWRDPLRTLPNVQWVENDPGNPLEFAGMAARRILSGDSPAPIELRRDQLASRDPLRQVRVPLRAAIVAALVFSVSLATAMLWRAHEYDRVSQSAGAQQEQAFHQALPRQTTPLSITARLRSEEKRLRGVSGTGSSLPPSSSVLPLLRQTLGGLPPKLRFRLLELRFEPQRLYLEGQTLDHSGADQIAAALRTSTGLAVDPPHTEQPSGEDVTFTIAAGASKTGSGGNLP
jgi:hypothetical protein